MATITEDEFDEQYGHVPAADGNFYREAHELKCTAEHLIWTAVDGDDGAIYLLPGFHRVNAFAYVVAERPWTDPMVEVCLDDGAESTQ